MLLVVASVFPALAAEKLDPFSAELTVAPTKSSSMADIRARLDFSIHNGDEGSLVGTKFLCMQDIDSLSVTDGEGRRLPYTLKSYPRKRIMWEYGPAKNGIRRAIISFVIRNGVTRTGEACTMDVDWIGGWNREVFNASYRIVLPGDLSERDIVSVTPSRYKFVKSPNESSIVYNFPVLDAKLLKIVYKGSFAGASTKTREQQEETPVKKPDTKKEPDAPSQQPAQIPAAAPIEPPHGAEPDKAPSVAGTGEDAPAPPDTQGKETSGEKYILTNVRCAPNGSGKDRLVFEVNRKIPYEIVSPEGSEELEIAWKVPVGIAPKVLDKKRIASNLIKGVRWKKSSDKKLSCIVQLQTRDLKIRYGSLDNPPRFYIDVSKEGAQKNIAAVAQQTPGHTDNKSDTQKQTMELPFQPQPGAAPMPAPSSVPVTSTVPAAVPPQAETPTSSAIPLKTSSIEEKLEYVKAKKLFEVKEYENAVMAYEAFLNKYPGSQLKESILFDIADAYYSTAEQQQPKNYNSAIGAYKKVLANFPESDRAAYATFQIAECHRKGEFYIEASAQYSLVIDRYPKSPLTLEARYWQAECLFLMQKFEDALKEFEKFVNDFPSGPHAREASFRIADCYAEIKDFERAEFYYEKALKRWPDLMELPVQTINNMAMTNYYKAKFEKSRELLFLSFNLYPSQENRARLLRFAGDSYQWEGDMQKALNIYGLLMDLFTDSEESTIAVMRMADLGVNVAGLNSDNFSYKNFNPYKEPDRAYQWITENATTREVLTEGFYKLGFTFAKKGKLAEAVEFFKKSMSQRESSMYYAKSFENIQKILSKMIHTAVEQEDYFTVVELYKRNEQVFLKNIDDCNFFYEVGRSYLELGLMADAEKLFTGLLQQAESPECRQKSTVGLSRIDIEKGNAEKAQERLNILLYGGKALASITDDAYHILGDAYFEDKKYKEAIDAYSIPLGRKGGASFRQAKSLLRIGEAFGKAGYYYNGIQSLKKLIAMTDQIRTRRPEITAFKDSAALLIGDYFLKKSNYSAAISAYKDLTKSAAGESEKSWAYLKWGDVLLQKGDYDNATKVFTRFSETTSPNVLNDFARSQINGIKWQNSVQRDLQNLM